MALHTVAYRWGMDRLPGLNFFLVMATEAESLRRGRRQLNAGDISGDANFVAAQTTRSNRRVNRLSFGLVFVALDALRRVYILLERDWMSLGKGWQNRNRRDVTQNYKQLGEGSPGYVRAISVLWDHAT
jgi:hypothetical protein